MGNCVYLGLQRIGGGGFTVDRSTLHHCLPPLRLHGQRFRFFPTRHSTYVNETRQPFDAGGQILTFTRGVFIVLVFSLDSAAAMKHLCWA